MTCPLWATSATSEACVSFLWPKIWYPNQSILIITLTTDFMKMFKPKALMRNWKDTTRFKLSSVLRSALYSFTQGRPDMLYLSLRVLHWHTVRSKGICTAILGKNVFASLCHQSVKSVTRFRASCLAMLCQSFTVATFTCCLLQSLKSCSVSLESDEQLDYWRIFYLVAPWTINSGAETRSIHIRSDPAACQLISQHQLYIGTASLWALTLCWKYNTNICLLLLSLEHC